MNNRLIHWMNENVKYVLVVILLLWLFADWLSESVTYLFLGS